MLAVAGAGIVLTWFFYRRAFALLRPAERRLLIALRWAAILLVVLLLFRPVLGYRKHTSQRPSLLFAVDHSGSMSIRDDPAGDSRFDQARRQVAQWCKKLDKRFDLHLVAFADRAGDLSDAEALAALAPDGRSTSLSRAILAARVRIPADRLAAVVLVTDGLHNSAGNPVETAQRLGAVVHTIGVGASLRGEGALRDVRITGVDCPERLLLGNKARITASVDAVGLAGQVVEVTLSDGSQQIGRTELALDQLEGGQQVEFEFQPTEKGRHVYTVHATPVPDEPIEQNNQRRAVALVVEPGIRVLYLEGTLRAEYGALVDRFLAKDPDLEFCALVQTRPNVFLTRSNIEGLDLREIPADRAAIDAFDVFIIGDLDSTFLRPDQQQLLIDRVRAGAGLVMLGGYHSLGPGGYGSAPLGQILPVTLGPRDVGQITDPFLPQLTPEGVRHPIFAGIAEFFPTRAQPEPARPGLPPLEGCTRVEGARPDATVLAACSLESSAMPVLVVGRSVEGRAAVFTGDTTRRWQQTPRVLGQDSPFLRFWGQLVRWLAGRKESVEAGARIEASVDRGYYEPDEPVRIRAVVRNRQGEAAADAQVAAEIHPSASGVSPAPGQNAQGTSSTARTLALAPVPSSPGHYEAMFEPAEPGTYEITLTAQLDPERLAAEPLTVEVGRPSLEFEQLDLDESMLRQIAQCAGGRYEHLTTAEALIDALDHQQQEKTVHFETRLYYPPLAWFLLIGALTTEWTLRRRFQLK